MTLIFDFDGVLGNTLEPWSIFLAKTFNIKEENARQKLISNGYDNKQDNWIQFKIKSLFFRILRANFSKASNLIFDDRLSEIQMTKAQKIILTRNDSKVCINLLGEYVNMFELIYGRKESKNKIKGLQKIIQELNISVENIIFFTDTVGDVKEIAKVLPLRQIRGVSWGYHGRNRLLEVLPSEQILDDFKKLF
jgi:phosphoglycolate phosphatase-like HAD superfamily hydrolase